MVRLIDRQTHWGCCLHRLIRQRTDMIGRNSNAIMTDCVEHMCSLINWVIKWLKWLIGDGVPAENMDSVRVVLERRELSPEHLQSLENLPVLQVLQILLLQEQELHTLQREGRKGVERWGNMRKLVVGVIRFKTTPRPLILCSKGGKYSYQHRVWQAALPWWE